MDSAGWVILLFIFGFFAFVIYIVRKDSSTEDDPPMPSPPSPAQKPPEPTPPKEKEQKFFSIYEYTPVQTVKRCAYCDGENKTGTKVCCICGNDIDS